MFENTIIFVSNACLDGFREGDGDLMDKLVSQLNRLGIVATRIIVHPGHLPEDKRHLLSKGEHRIEQIIPLKSDSAELKAFESGTDKYDESERFIAGLQERLCALFNDPFRDKQKILYIGSRFDLIDSTKEQPIRKGSGSLFTKPFLLELKRMGVKIVVCCLEYKFFRRSLVELPKVIEMLRQQLFMADKIHFLTQHDKSNFEKTIDWFRKGPSSNEYPLPAHRLAIKSTPESSSSEPRSSSSSYSESSSSAAGSFTSSAARLERDLREMNPKDFEEQKEKGVFVSGIYTTDPLRIEDILRTPASSPANETTERDLIQKLSERPPNILCYGLIRRNKGIDEAILLSENLRRISEWPGGERPKIIIAGKLMGASFFYFRDLMTKIFRIKKSEFKKIARQSLSEFEKQGKLIAGLTVTRLDLVKVNESIFTKGKDGVNEFCDLIYRSIQASLSSSTEMAIELHINLSELKVRELAMRCRYAIKLDHKGMANNASTIASCLGMYLPTFTSCGLVTDDSFRELGTHQNEGSLSKKPFPSQYQLTVIMPQKEYYTEKGEVKPKLPDFHFIIDVLMTEMKDIKHYQKRLFCLLQLYKDGVFQTELVIKRLISGVFSKLVDATAPKEEAIDDENEDNNEEGSSLAMKS